VKKNQPTKIPTQETKSEETVTEEMAIDLGDILSIVLNNMPDIEVQKAMIDEVQSLIKKGSNERMAVARVFGPVLSDENKGFGKPH